MAKATELAPGFDEVPLEEGFEEVPLESAPSNEYLEKAKELGQSALETASDTSRGLIEGATAGFSDEILGGIKATGAKALGMDEGQSWKDLYRKYQQQQQAIQEASAERSPFTHGAGEIGGMIAPALLTGGASVPAQAAARSVPLIERAAVAGATGAGIGALSGVGMSEEGKLIGASPEEQEQLLSDVKSATLTGGIIGGGLGAAVPLVRSGVETLKKGVSSKISNFMEDSPFWTQVKKSKELGEEGTNIYSDKAITGETSNLATNQLGPQVKPGLIHQDTNATKDLIDRVYNVDSKLGKAVGDSIEKATNDGIQIDLTKPMLNSVNTFKNLLDKDQTLLANPKAQKLYDTIFKMSEHGDVDVSKLTPKEVQSLRNEVIEFADSIKLKNPDIASLGYEFQGQIGGLLKSSVPEYKIAAERFEQFRRLVPETIISGSTPIDISGVKLGSLKNDEAKLFSSAKNMIQGARMPGTAAMESKETFKNFLNGLNEFSQNEAQRVKLGLIKNTDVPKLIDQTSGSQTQAMEKLIKEKADQSALLQQAWRVNPQESAGTSIKGSIFGKGSVMNLANKYGLYKDTLLKPVKAPAELSKQLYNSSETQLKGLAQKMSEVPGLGNLGKMLLEGIENKDKSGINAAIFSIMQNPQARILVNGDEESK